MCGWEGDGDGVHPAGRGVATWRVRLQRAQQAGAVTLQKQSRAKSVDEGKEIYSPDVENAKCQTRLGDREPYSVQSVSEFGSCIEGITHLKEPKEKAIGCWMRWPQEMFEVQISKFNPTMQCAESDCCSLFVPSSVFFH